MTNKNLRVVILVAATFLGLIATLSSLSPLGKKNSSRPLYAAAASVPSPFNYLFNIPGTLYEAGTMNETTSPYWWVNSGAKLVLSGGIGETIQGSLPYSDPWRGIYALNNPVDTDLGLHPQNIFRLVSRNQWNNVRLEASYYINKDNFSTSLNRNQSNGLLLMSRYHTNGDTLYYAGIRVDGTAVIKKKINGTYYTMAQKQIFLGTYSRDGLSVKDRNLLPHKLWIRLRSETTTDSNGNVTVKLSMQNPEGARWETLLIAKDSGQYGGTAPIIGAGYSGIRTDFMDVKFENWLAQAL